MPELGRRGYDRNLALGALAAAGGLGILAGYFVIRAASLEEAERIAAECPHLTYGGAVSVRPTGA